MIKIQANARTFALSQVLDKTIEEYSKNAPGKIVGAPDDSPKLSDEDLTATRKKGDVTVALDVFTYYIEKFDEKKVKTAAQGLFPDNILISISGRFHYPPKGFMGWHTNSNAEGWRVYASRSDENNKSFFRYYRNGKVITEYEKAGWNFRAFQVQKGHLYWHCVYTDTNRYSFGFRFQR